MYCVFSLSSFSTLASMTWSLQASWLKEQYQYNTIQCSKLCCTILFIYVLNLGVGWVYGGRWWMGWKEAITGTAIHRGTWWSQLWLLHAVFQILLKCVAELGLSHHSEGTMVTIEGPRFSTKMESKLFHNWGAHVVNMSTVPEVCVCVCILVSECVCIFIFHVCMCCLCMCIHVCRHAIIHTLCVYFVHMFVHVCVCFWGWGICIYVCVLLYIMFCNCLGPYD